MTATPCRGDGRGLGDDFDEMIEAPQVQQLIEMGYLVGTKVYAPSTPDLRGVRIRHGDYVESDLAYAVDKPQLVGDIVSHWHRLADGRKTVVFASSVRHSIHLCEEFIESGVRAEHIDGSTPKEERDSTLKRLSDGDLDLVTNCMVLAEGWDQPDVSCCILARPTRHMGLYRQMVGRTLRPFPGKADALVLDHAGAVFAHGFCEDRVEWTLRTDRRAEAPAHTARGNDQRSSNRLLSCTVCSAVRSAGKPCPSCGYMPRRPGEYLDVQDGDLAHLGRNGRQQVPQYSDAEKQRWHRMLLFIAMERNYKSGWAAHKFKEKFGVWPARETYEIPLEPSREVLSWERSRRIAYAKGMAARRVSNG